MRAFDGGALLTAGSLRCTLALLAVVAALLGGVQIAVLATGRGS